jgi:hypothetical protein
MPRTRFCNRFAGAVQQTILLVCHLLGQCIHSFPYILLLVVVTSPLFLFWHVVFGPTLHRLVSPLGVHFLLERV